MNLLRGTIFSIKSKKDISGIENEKDFLTLS